MKVAVVGTSGLDLLIEPLRSAMAEAIGDTVEVKTGRYGLWKEDLRDSPADLADPQPELVLVVLDGQDLFEPFWAETVRDVEHIAEQIRTGLLRDVIGSLERGLALFDTAQVMVTTVCHPQGMMLGSLRSRAYCALDEAVDDFNRGLRRWAMSGSRTQVIDVHAIATMHGEAVLRDNRLWCLARCRWSRRGLALMAARVVATWRAVQGVRRKCIVVDLDNTLWGGVVGEAGLSGIELGHEGVGLAFREFQMRLARLRDQGVLLAIASKNDESTVWEAMERHPAMVLGQSSFSAWRIGWGDKAASVREIADELGIGLDSIVFLDDQAAERARVRDGCDGVVAPDFPDDVALLPGFAEQLMWRYFNRVAIQPEDFARVAWYGSQSERQSSCPGGAPVEESLAALEMRSRVRLAEPAVYGRVADLTQKTNQFNLTGRRYREDEIRKMAGSDEWLIVTADLKDRFADAGLVVAALLQRLESATWRIDNFVMSCRVIGRGLESAVISAVGEIVRSRGGRFLRAEYCPTPRNAVAKSLWSDLGFDEVDVDDDGRSTWRCDLAECVLPNESPIDLDASELNATGALVL